MTWFQNLAPHWAWIGLGLILAIGEMIVPGVFLIWLAGAAVITGVVAWLVPGLGVPLEVVLFALLAIAAVFSGRNWLRRNPIAAADPKMNDRGARMLGETVTVTQAIDGGSGRIRHGDSEWLARGPEAAAGTRMRVSGNDGAVLLVEHLH